MRLLRALLLLSGLVLVAAPPRAQIVINEIMYNSVASEGDADVEFVELYNNGAVVQDLTGWYLLDDNDLHAKCFLEGSLPPGEWLAVAGNLALFSAKYPEVANVNPNPFQPGFSFGNSGDQVRLFNQGGIPVDSVAYSDDSPWPTEADGNGPSLELVDPDLDNDLASSWAPSTNPPPDGTPGTRNSTVANPDFPVVTDVARSVALPENTHTVSVTAGVTDEQGLSGVELFVDVGTGFASQGMIDLDGSGGDPIFGATIAPQATGTLVRYYVSATDTEAHTVTEPADAPDEYLAYTVGHEPPVLRINEIVAFNATGLSDGVDGPEDWLEIRNPGPDPVDLDGMFLSNNLDQTTEWRLPAVVLDPGEFLLLWCDDDTGQGALHTSFKLSKTGADVGLFDTVDHGNVLIHGFAFGLQNPDVSFGFLPDDSDAPEYIATPSPGASNDGATYFSPVCINEFQTTSAGGGVDDWVEFHNRGGTTVNLTGWHITDDVALPAKYTFGSTTLAPGEYLSRDEVELGFSFPQDGSEIIMLTHADGVTGQDFFDYGPQFADVSQGRFPDGTPNWHFFDATSRDLANGCDGGATPGPVANLRFSSPTTFTWDAASGAEDYDTVEGDLAPLRAGSGDYAGAVSGCLENNGTDETSWDVEVPASGEGFFYLVRATDRSCGFGSYDTGYPSQQAERDGEIASAGPTCP